MKKTIELSLEQARDWYNDTTSLVIKRLLVSNFSKEELEKKELPKSWEELKVIKGFSVTLFSSISVCGSSKTTGDCKKNIYATEKQAKSALAMAQLSQLMAVYNDGWEANWNNINQYKFCIGRFESRLNVNWYSGAYHFIAFKTAEIRDEFLKNFEPLIKEYFEL